MAATAPVPFQYVGTAVRRYSDAYRVANTTVAIGKALKIVGLIGAILIFVASLPSATGQNSVSPFSSSSIAIGGVMFGVIFALFFGLVLWLVGILVCALGQTTLAALDSAVNSSPFLELQDKAAVMSLKPDRSSGHADTREKSIDERKSEIECPKCSTNSGQIIETGKGYARVKCKNCNHCWTFTYTT